MAPSTKSRAVHEPVRTCVGCRKPAISARLVRVVRHEDSGELRIERSGPGRGAWLCVGPVPTLPARECLDQAVRRRAFTRAFRVAVDAGAVIALREKVEERARIDSGGAATATGQRRD